jgi:putative oxygen-independent coproporphyrinogen III oxidase
VPTRFGSLSRAVLPENWQQSGFGLYIHWPFCAAKCPYCDFNSHVSARIDQSRWRDAYIREIARAAELTEGRVLSTVFFGGGTPSLMDGETVQAILDEVRRSWPVSNDIEITLEANPTSVDAARFGAYREAGVNRLSMGIQALNNDDLRLLGRLHSVEEAFSAFKIARATFSRVSFDLIYARQNQTLADWESELHRALDLAVDHLSLYQLTIEEGTAFGDRYSAGKLRGLPNDDLAADMFEATQRITESFGFHAYETSNHARSGEESRHNLIYWRYGDYLGIGPGAHGRLSFGPTRQATEAFREPGKWLAAVSEHHRPEHPVQHLSQDDILAEMLLMGLRLREGVPVARYLPLANEEIINNINELVEDGLLVLAAEKLTVSDEGRPLLNTILRKILGA